MKYIAGVILAYSLIAVTASFKTKCFPEFGKYPFDESKFSGDWYIVAAATTIPRPHGVCNKINYNYEHAGNITKIQSKVSIKNADGTEKLVEMKGHSFIPELTSSTQITLKKHPEDKFHGVADSTVLATDYESYAIISICKEFFDEDKDSINKLHLMSVLSRTPTLENSIRQVLKSILTSYDFDISEVHDIDNSAC